MCMTADTRFSPKQTNPHQYVSSIRQVALLMISFDHNVQSHTILEHTDGLYGT